MIHNISQSSKEWHDFRSKHFGASEAPIAAGVSKYTRRNDLLNQKHFGISPDVDARTQEIFNRGHIAEGKARIIAEEIIGDELSPLVMSKVVDGLPLSASLDGCTFSGDIVWECKLWNEKLAESVRNRELEPHYRLQLDQQLLVSGASKCLFMVTDGTKEKMEWMWYSADQADFDFICNTWKQFAADLATYQHTPEAEAVVADAVMALPSLAVQIKGEVTTSNLPVFVSAADKFLAGIKTTLETDQDFANAEANVKACKTAEDGIEQTKKAITAQAVSIDEVMRTMDLYKEKLAAVRLKLDKLVKSEKEKRKEAIIDKARIAFNEHFTTLEAEIKPIRLIAQHPDFAGAMKGLKKLSAMQAAVDTALRDGKFAADQVAADVRKKLAWCQENAAGMSMLFPDLQQLVAKPMEDFTLTITSRIEEHKADEVAKLEAARYRIQAEEEAKARAKVEEEQRVASMILAAANLPEIPDERRAEVMRSLSKPSQDVYSYAPHKDDIGLVQCVADHYGVQLGEACDRILVVAGRMLVTA